MKKIVPGKEPHIAPGVRGYTIDEDNTLWVPLVIADRPGSGDVSRFLDSLPTHKTVKFHNVLSVRLMEMLSRRGFTLTFEIVFVSGHLEVVDVWVRPPVQ